LALSSGLWNRCAPRRSVNQQIVHLIEEFVKKEKKTAQA
jgi:hypothetical protein